MVQPMAPNSPGGRGLGIGRRVGEEGRVAGGGGLADLGDEVVGGVVAPDDDTLLGEVPHHPPRVRGVADLDVLVGSPAEEGLEVGGVRRDGVDVPPGQVGGGRPLLGRHLLQEVGERVDRLPPDGDVSGQALGITHAAEPRAWVRSRSLPRASHAPARSAPPRPGWSHRSCRWPPRGGCARCPRRGAPCGRWRRPRARPAPASAARARAPVSGLGPSISDSAARSGSMTRRPECTRRTASASWRAGVSLTTNPAAPASRARRT